MKFFISSLIRGMEAERAAVIGAIEGLGHRVVRAEDFSAKPESPRVACLTAVRNCDGFILIAGERYGQRQPSGKSATHEEYDAASGTKPVFVFIDTSARPEPDQAEFLQQVQDWQSGDFTAAYDTPDDLRQEVSRALHQWLLAQAAGTFDSAEAAQRAMGMLPPEQRGYSTGRTRLSISVAFGPVQAILRPSELEDTRLTDHLTKEVLFATPPLFSARKGTDASIEGHTLWLRQDHEALALSEDGSIVITRLLSEGDSGVLALIEEEVEEKTASALAFAAAVLDHVDPTNRLTHAAIAVNLYEAEHRSWRTRAQHGAQPNSGTMNMRHGESEPVTLQPAHRPRGALNREAATLAKDFTVLLRRAWTRT